MIKAGWYCALGMAMMALGSLMAQAAEQQTTATAAGWQLVWSDEFNTDGAPDPANWGFEHGFVRNNELQWYQPENATCKGGILTIEARREHKPNPTYRPGRRGMAGRKFIEYTSACLITRHKHEFKYGKFELRGRIDVRPGSWPAFWSLGLPGRGVSWPTCGEVDTMEYYRGNVLANVCYGRDHKAVWKETKTPYTQLGGEAWVKQFHVWTMEWDEKKIDLLLDGKLMNHFDVASATLADGFNAFQQLPQYILINQAIGGNQGGDPSKTAFPVKFEVDWVRVYQRKP